MQRYTPFNVSAMHSKIAKVCGADVVSWDKKEGVFNKSFITTLSNGKQVVVRVKVRYHPYHRCSIAHYLKEPDCGSYTLHDSQRSRNDGLLPACPEHAGTEDPRLEFAC